MTRGLNYVDLLEDVLARLVAASEACDAAERDQILVDLEVDVLASLEWQEAA
jgi:hypothetical protein